MTKKDLEIITQLASLINRFNASRDFLQLMFVYKRVKKGYFPQTKDDTQTKNVFENEVTPLLRQLGFYVSFKHGGYVTYDIGLYQSWNGLGFYWRRKHFASYYLGYPDCCELRYNVTEQLLSFHLYFIIKRMLLDKDKTAAAKFDLSFKDLMEIEEYQSCVIGCPKTHRRAQVFREVREGFSQFLPSNYMAKRREATKNALLDMLKPVNFRYTQHKMKKVIPLLRQHRMRELFQLDDIFFQEIEEFLETPHSKKEMIARAEAFIISL